MPRLTKTDWCAVLDCAKDEKLYTSLDAKNIVCFIDHGRGLGLSEDERQKVESKDTNAKRMQLLVKYVGTRPSLVDSFLKVLEDNHKALYEIVKEEVDKRSVKGEDNEENDDAHLKLEVNQDNEVLIRRCLESTKDSISVLAEWAVPHLRKVISDDEGREVEGEPQSLLKCLKTKGVDELNNFFEFLRDYHRDILREIYDASEMSTIEKNYEEHPGKEPPPQSAQASGSNLDPPMKPSPLSEALEVDVTEKKLPPSRDGHHTPTVEGREGDHWRQIRTQLRDVPSPVAAQFEVLYDSGERAVSCTSPKLSYCDLQSGAEVEDERATHWVRRFLRDETAIRWHHDTRPALIVYSNATVEKFVQSGRSIGSDHNLEHLFDRRNMILLWGYRLRSGAVLIKLLGRELADISSGNVIPMNEATNVESAVLLLLGEGDRVPRVPMPPQKLVDAYSRGDGVEVRGGIVRRKPCVADLSEEDGEWLHKRRVRANPLLRQLTDAMRL